MITRFDVEVGVGKLLGQLLNAGRIDTSKLTPEEKKRHVLRIAETAGLAFATMPAMQEAMALAHPEARTEDRYALMVEAIMLVFGVDQAELQKTVLALGLSEGERHE